MSKEAEITHKINKFLEASGQRFFDDKNGEVNIQCVFSLIRRTASGAI